MANTISLDYALAKKYLKAMENLTEPEIAASTGTVRIQLVRLLQIDVPGNCKGSYADVTVEKLIQLHKEWQDIMFHIRDCKEKIANKVEQLHAYDMQQQAQQEKLNYQPISTFNYDGDYRANVSKINSAFSQPQTQIYENGGGGNCHIAAMTRLLNRKAYLDGHGTSTYSVESVYASAGATNIQKVGNYRSGIKYKYNGSTGSKVPSATYTVGDVSYKAHCVKKGTMTSASGGADAYMTNLLDKHPEGVTVRTNGHVAVITDYEVVNGKVQYYVSDSFTKGNGISKSGRIKIEDSSLYNGVNANTKFYNMGSFDYISYLT